METFFPPPFPKATDSRFTFILSVHPLKYPTQLNPSLALTSLPPQVFLEVFLFKVNPSCRFQRGPVFSPSGLAFDDLAFFQSNHHVFLFYLFPKLTLGQQFESSHLFALRKSIAYSVVYTPPPPIHPPPMFFEEPSSSLCYYDKISFISHRGPFPPPPAHMPPPPQTNPVPQLDAVLLFPFSDYLWLFPERRGFSPLCSALTSSDARPSSFVSPSPPFLDFFLIFKLRVSNLYFPPSPLQPKHKLFPSHLFLCRPSSALFELFFNFFPPPLHAFLSFAPGTRSS